MNIPELRKNTKCLLKNRYEPDEKIALKIEKWNSEKSVRCRAKGLFFNLPLNPDFVEQKDNDEVETHGDFLNLIIDMNLQSAEKYRKEPKIVPL